MELTFRILLSNINSFFLLNDTRLRKIHDWFRFDFLFFLLGKILKKSNINEETLKNEESATDKQNDTSISGNTFNREDSLTSKKSFENVPEIKIIKTDNMEENVNGEFEKKPMKPSTKNKETTVNIHETN